MVKPVRLGVLFLFALATTSFVLWAISARYPRSGTAYGAEGSGDPKQKDEGRWGVEIQINNTAAVNDDMVRLPPGVPTLTPPLPFPYTVPCQARLFKNNPSDPLPLYHQHQVVLTNGSSHGQVLFPSDTTVKLVLDPPAAGSAYGPWGAFSITGDVASASRNDAEIDADDMRATGAIVGHQYVTVFHFEPGAHGGMVAGAAYAASPQVTGTDPFTHKPAQGYYYTPGGDTTHVAMQIWGAAFLLPRGLDTTAPQLKNIVVGVAQDAIQGSKFTYRYATPQVYWYGQPLSQKTPANGQVAVAGDTVSVPASVTYTTTVPVTCEDNDQTSPDQSWLYGMTPGDPDSEVPPQYPSPPPGVWKAVRVTDAPEIPFTTLGAAAFLKNQNGKIVAYAIWTLDTTGFAIDVSFKDYTTVYDSTANLAPANQVEMVQEQDWGVNVAGNAANQEATHGQVQIPPATQPADPTKQHDMNWQIDPKNNASTNAKSHSSSPW